MDTIFLSLYHPATPTKNDLDSLNDEYPAINVGKMEALARNLTKNPDRLEKTETCFKVARSIFAVSVLLTAPVFFLIYLKIADIWSMSAMSYQFCGIFIAHAAHVPIVIYSFFDPEMSENIRNVFKNMKMRRRVSKS